MAGWDEILKEANDSANIYDNLRLKYLTKLNEYTGRNIIAYYSSWLNKRGQDNLDINDRDMNGFMNALRGLDCSTGVDLILHTPGGDPAAAEAIVYYLRNKFNNDIRVLIPQMAMSAGTMMACASKEIIMGKHSSLGPIDPQFNGIPAYNIKEEFEEAKRDLVNNPQNAQYWAIKLQQYPAAFMKSAIDAIELAEILVREWLETGMFADDEKDGVIENIVKTLNSHDSSKIHARHLNLDQCKELGLKIRELESDQVLQDLLLSVHHSYMITMDNSPALKIIENQNGKRMISNMQISNVPHD